MTCRVVDLTPPRDGGRSEGPDLAAALASECTSLAVLWHGRADEADGDPRSPSGTGPDAAALIRRSHKPVAFAATGIVEGDALGIALACDVVLATPACTFRVGRSGTDLATLAAAGRSFGRGVARHLALDPSAGISAEEAHAAGVVTRLVPVDRLLTDSTELAAAMATAPKFTAVKKIVNLSVDSEVATALSCCIDRSI
ncbi:MAG: enoyl-CoA hydratase/isomerase family protein [Acidimicrobiia bacterium]